MKGIGICFIFNTQCRSKEVLGCFGFLLGFHYLCIQVLSHVHHFTPSLNYPLKMELKTSGTII